MPTQGKEMGSHTGIKHTHMHNVLSPAVDKVRRGHFVAVLFYTQKYKADTASARPTRAPRHLDSHPEAGTQTKTEKQPANGCRGGEL